MDVQRIIKYCQQSIEMEKKKTSPSNDKIKAMKDILEHISNADTPKPDEREEIINIFKKHHKEFTGTNYVFTLNQYSEIDGIIKQIKQEVLENTDAYGEITLGQFFELFMSNMDIANSDNFWRRHHFTTWGVNKQFPKILSQIKSNKPGAGNSGSKSGSNKKPSYFSVLK